MLNGLCGATEEVKRGPPGHLLAHPAVHRRPAAAHLAFEALANLAAGSPAAQSALARPLAASGGAGTAGAAGRGGCSYTLRAWAWMRD